MKTTSNSPLNLVKIDPSKIIIFWWIQVQIDPSRVSRFGYLTRTSGKQTYQQWSRIRTVPFQIRMQPQTGAGSFATARDCENFICVAGRKKLQRQESISLKSSALYHLSTELVLFQLTGPYLIWAKRKWAPLLNTLWY